MFDRYTARPRCIRCCVGWLEDRRPSAPSASLQIDRIHCRHCGEFFDAWGESPLLLQFGVDDMPRVLDMVANRGVGAQKPQGAGRLALFDLLSAFHSASTTDRALLVASNPSLADWGTAGSAYSDWAHTNALFGGSDRSGACALKIGAGTGIDEVALDRAGLRITCLEWHLPTLLAAERTRSSAAWIGGVAEHIPFDDESFDLVYANAVMQDVASPQQALRELLRVVRVGGEVMVSQIALGPEWDGGVHAAVPARRLASRRAAIPFAVLSSILAEFSDVIAIALVVDVDLNEELEGRSQIGSDAFGGFWAPAWNANMAVLERASGFISLCMVKKAAVAIAPNPATASGGVPVTSVALWIDDDTELSSRIAPWIEPALLCTGPIAATYQRHEWSLGWGPVPDQPLERAARWQARWLVPCHNVACRLDFEIRLQGGSSASVDLVIEGAVLTTVSCNAGWSPVTVVLDPTPVDTVAILEFVLLAAHPADQGGFRVRHRQVSAGENAGLALVEAAQ